MARRELVVDRIYTPQPEACQRAVEKLLAKKTAVGRSGGGRDDVEGRLHDNAAEYSIRPRSG